MPGEEVVLFGAVHGDEVHAVRAAKVAGSLPALLDVLTPREVVGTLPEVDQALSVD